MGYGCSMQLVASSLLIRVGCGVEHHHRREGVRGLLPQEACFLTLKRFSAALFLGGGSSEKAFVKTDPLAAEFLLHMAGLVAKSLTRGKGFQSSNQQQALNRQRTKTNTTCSTIEYGSRSIYVERNYDSVFGFSSELVRVVIKLLDGVWEGGV